MNVAVLNIAVPVPLFQCFSYLADTTDPSEFKTGIRIQVPFGNRTLTGILISIEYTESPSENLKPIIQLLDTTPVFNSSMMQFIQWLANYYQHPIGETFSTALPSLLRKGEPTPSLTQSFLSLTESGLTYQPASNAKAQLQLIEQLKTQGKIAKNKIKTLALSTSAIKNLEQKGIVHFSEEAISPKKQVKVSGRLALNEEQQHCLDQFLKIDGFKPILLEGVTGSGKTEVYLQLIEQCINKGQQALVLVPEIGLTPQTVSRFADRFNCPIAVLHSSINDRKRLEFWQQGRKGVARIIIGTRSALFSPTQSLGLIIVDEEHDLSYKQQDGLKYSARDAALIRAKIENCPVLLGSATPSLESLHNAKIRKFAHWMLKQRAGNASQAELQILDIRHQRMHEGLSDQALAHLEETMNKGEQALIFLNRRGFSPTLICHDCGWIARCDACDSNLTVHLNARHLRCHHCQCISPIPRECPSCQSDHLFFQGVGSQRAEQALQQHFPGTPIYRIDRDSTQSQKQMNDMLNRIQSDEAAILIGTQMLAKGHHFPNVTLVIMLEADNGLTGVDYRALERFGQLLIQVTGRAGRESKKGRALIQSHYPEHPELNQLISHGYHEFALKLLAQRQQLKLPPFSHQALIRLEDKNGENAFQLLETFRQYTLEHFASLQTLGPYPAQLQKRAHYYRYQLLLQSDNRALLHEACHYVKQIAGNQIKQQQRFSIDIDPMEMA